MYDALQDQLCRPALIAFFASRRIESLESLVSAIRTKERDTMREAHLAGMVDAYETALADLERFAKSELEAAKG